MYGMTREEAADKALAYERLVIDVRRVHAYLLSTMPTGSVSEIMRPVDRVLLDSALSEAAASATVPEGMVLVSRSFLEATPCPNCDGSGFFTSTGPDPEQEQCQWCFEKHMILSGAQRAAAPSPSATPVMPTESEIRLAAGEMTAQEMRTAKAVLAWFIRSLDRRNDGKA